MNLADFSQRLRERVAKAGLSLSAGTIDRLALYFQLLARWNQRINLTGLSLNAPTDQTFDRLFVEPVIATGRISSAARTWFDLGSGGGSPAVPMKILKPDLRLVMVEVRARKCAFLREVARILALDEVYVEEARFEEVAADVPATADLVTIRAVRLDENGYVSASQLLVDHGTFLWFTTSGTKTAGPDFDVVSLTPLTPSNGELMELRRVPRGTKA